MNSSFYTYFKPLSIPIQLHTLISNIYIKKNSPETSRETKIIQNENYFLGQYLDTVCLRFIDIELI